MKNLIFIFSSLLFLIITGCYSPGYVNPDKYSSLISIHEYKGQSKDELYDQCESWVAREFNKANEVIQYRNKEDGQIICRGISSISSICNRRFSFTAILDVKEERVRIRYEAIQPESTPACGGPDMTYKWDEVKDCIDTMSEDLHKYIIHGDMKGSDW